MTATALEIPALATHLIAATREVFEKMVRTSLVTGEPIEGDALRPASNVVGAVSFTGSRNGIVAFYATFDSARRIASSLLNTPVDGREQIGDAVGELTNMIAGTFRNHMMTDGSIWAISIPAVTIGSDFYTKYVSDVRRVLCPFRAWEDEMFVEVILVRDSRR